jgi:hypothetical protein
MVQSQPGQIVHVRPYLENTQPEQVVREGVGALYAHMNNKTMRI